jgi:hypothetical protein
MNAVAPFAEHIITIFFIRSEEKMCRIDARRIITVVTDLQAYIVNFSIGQHPSYPMCELYFPAPLLQSIPVTVSRTKPEPAISWVYG